MRPVCFSRTTFVVRSTDAGQSEAADVRIAGVELLLRRRQRFGAPANSASATALLMLAAGIPEPGSAVSNVMRQRLAGIRRARARDDEQPFRAALARRERLVAKIGIARERRFGLGVGVFGEVVEDEDDLVFHVKACVAVVAEVLRLGHDEAVAGKDQRRA